MADDQSLNVEFSYHGRMVKMRLPSGADHISKSILGSRCFYELELLESLAPSLQPGDVVVDAGANIGNHTIFFAAVCGCRVHAFEAVDSTAHLLQFNVAENLLHQRVVVHTHALGERIMRADVGAYDPSNVGGTSLVAADQGQIRVLPLDGVELPRPIRLIKIDVEGMDLQVLRGASSILSRDRPWVVCEAGSLEFFREISEFMSRLEYQLAGVYNATDTYVFLPAADERERAIVARYSSEVIMGLQRELRAARDWIAQVGRYSERMRAEAIAASHKEVEAVQKEIDELRETARMTASERAALEMCKRVLQIKEDTIADARASVEYERKARAKEAAALRKRLEAAESEVARVTARFCDMRDSFARDSGEQTARCSEMKLQIEQLSGRLAEARLAVERKRERLVEGDREVKKLRGDVAGLHGRVQRARERAERAEGDLARHRRALSRARRELGSTSEALNRVRGELDALRHSLTFRVVSHLRAAVRSPLDVLKLPLSLPILLYRELRARMKLGGTSSPSERDGDL